MLSAAGVSAQSLPEGMTALLPDGVKANLSQTKHVQEQKNLVVAGSPQKGYYAFFQAADSDHGEELWITDGTPAGTRMVKDINPGVATSNIQYLTRFNDKVVFSADDGENGQEIWISDGTENGTYLLKDIHELDSSNPLAFCQMDENHLVFFAMDLKVRRLVLIPNNGYGLLMVRKRERILSRPLTVFIQVKRKGIIDGAQSCV